MADLKTEDGAKHCIAPILLYFLMSAAPMTAAGMAMASAPAFMVMMLSVMVTMHIRVKL